MPPDRPRKPRRQAPTHPEQLKPTLRRATQGGDDILACVNHGNHLLDQTEAHMAVMKQDRFGFAEWEVFEVVVECSAGDVWGGCAEGFFGCLVLDGGGVVLGRVPDVLGGVVVGRVRRQENRCDALQQPVGLVEVGQGSGVVGAGVVRDDRGLAGAGFLLERVRCEGRLLGVLVLLGRVRRDCSAGRGGRRGRTGTSSSGPRTVWCVVLSGAACGGSRPRARGGPRLWCGPSGPGPTSF